MTNMTYSEYCEARASVLRAYVAGFIGYFTAQWRMLELRQQYGS